LEQLVLDPLPFASTIGLAKEDARAAGPPDVPWSAGRAIPLFLGHLLF
jgi:hypothetical protein